MTLRNVIHVAGTKRLDRNGQELQLYAVASEKLVGHSWYPDEIMHVHASSEANARYTYWQSVPVIERGEKRVVSIGLSVGGIALDENGDNVVI
jgi:hypothetical protein